MNILWLNLRKSGRKRTIAAVLDRLIEATRTDLVLSQETFGGGRPGNLRLGGMQPIHLSDDLCAFGASTLRMVEQIVWQPFLLGLRVEGKTFFNVHLSAYRSAARQAQLSRISEILAEQKTKYIITGGDFNFAPRDEDGLYNGEVSTWTQAGERISLSTLMRNFGLSDILSEASEQQFSVEKHLRGGLVQFRCDLVLCPNALLRTARAHYLHETRRGPFAFTDHSGILLTLGDDHEP